MENPHNVTVGNTGFEELLVIHGVNGFPQIMVMRTRVSGFQDSNGESQKFGSAKEVKFNE